MPDVALREQELAHLLRWFIRVRWVFLAGLAFAIVVGAYPLHLRFAVGKTLAVGAAVLAYNVLLFLRHRRLRAAPTPRLDRSRAEAAVQIGLDLLALTSLVHLSGGAESPFLGFYLFHAVVGSMLLSKEEAWLVGLVAFAMFMSVAALEYASVFPHYDPTALSAAVAPSRHRHVPYLAVVSLAFLATVFSAISITSSIVSTLRLRERQLIVTQKALVKKSHELEQAYATLTERQQQLVQTEKQASLGQLVAGIAHEINNPIQFIYGNMGILTEAFSDMLPVLDEHSATRPDLRIARLEYPFFRKQLRVLLKDMADGAARIGAIVRDLKTFARREEGRLDENVDLNEAVLASLRLLHAPLRRFRIEQQLDPNLPKVRGNLTKLEQVVVNALQNAAEALDHTESGLIRIRTCAEYGGTRVRLSIVDNGAGMPPEVRDRIFDPFFTTKQRSGGTGLGLAITYGIIQQHQGQIEVETQPGSGTSFHFLLPVKGIGVACTAS